MPLSIGSIQYNDIGKMMFQSTLHEAPLHVMIREKCSKTDSLALASCCMWDIPEMSYA